MRTALISGFVGREDELRRVVGCARLARRGRLSIVLVEGEPGIGKTRLLDAACGELRSDGFTVLRGRADELDQADPLGVVSRAGRLGTERPAQQPGLPGAAAFALLQAVIDDLQRRAAEGPVALVLEDLQWADPLTFVFLRSLPERLVGVPLAVLGSLRPLAGDRVRQEAVGALLEAGSECVRLGALSDDEVVELVAMRLGGEPSGEVLEWARAAGGNPLYVVQMLSSAVGDTTVAGDARDRVSGRVEAVPVGLRAVLERRLAALDPRAAEVVAVASVLGREFSPELLARLVGSGVAAIFGSLEQSLELGILREAGGRLAFAHEVLRTVAYEGVAPVLRAALHLEAARALLEMRGSPSLVAAHLRRGAREPSAVPLLREVAAQLSARAPASGAELLETALELMDVTDPERDSVAVELVRLLAWSGRARSAAEQAERTLAGGLAPEAEARLRIGLAEAMAMQGRSGPVLEQLERAQRLPGLVDEQLAPLLGTVAHARLFVGELAESEAAAAAALAAAERAGDEAAACWALMARSIALRFECRLHDALAAAEDAVARADGGPQPARLRQPRLFLAPTLVALDRFEEADAVFASGRRSAEALGAVFSLPVWSAFRAAMLRSLGRYDEAVAEAEAAVQLGEELQTRNTTPMALAILAEIAIRRNDLAAAAERLEQGWHLVHGGVDWTAQHLAWSSALLEDAQGKREAALANLEAGPLPLAQRIDLIAADHAVAPATVRIALRAGARELARAVADRTDQAAARNPSVGSLAAAAEHCRALIAGDLDSLERAILRWRESGRVPALADACEDAGRLALAGDDKARAREWLQEAYRAHEQLTADAGVARVAEALRSLGVRRRRAAKTVAAGSGWGSLTEAERKIAALVAEGLSNPQIAERRYISRHTVESHLKHIYLKLAIGSRVELAKLALTHTPQS